MSRLNPHCEQSVSGTCSVKYTYIAQIQLHREERVSFLQAILYTKHGNFPPRLLWGADRLRADDLRIKYM